MKQRVGIALAMLMEPPVLLADEPTSALDVAVQKQVLEEMLHLREVFGTAMILVTHDIGVVSAMADTVLVLKRRLRGRVWHRRKGAKGATPGIYPKSAGGSSETCEVGNGSNFRSFRFNKNV